MVGLQELIHKFEEGEGRRLIQCLAFMLGVLALIVLYDTRAYKNFSNPEAMDAAQLARNISEGRGFQTDFVRPLSLHLIKTNNENSDSLLDKGHPDIANAPVYPFLLGGLMKVLPFDYETAPLSQFTVFKPEMIITWFNQFLFCVAIFLVFRLASGLFDSGVAWISVFLMVGCELLWKFSVSGLSTMLLIVVFLSVILALVAVRFQQAVQFIFTKALGILNHRISRCTKKISRDRIIAN